MPLPKLFLDVNLGHLLIILTMTGTVLVYNFAPRNEVQLNKASVEELRKADMTIQAQAHEFRSQVLIELREQTLSLKNISRELGSVTASLEVLKVEVTEVKRRLDRIEKRVDGK